MYFVLSIDDHNVDSGTEFYMSLSEKQHFMKIKK